MSLFPDVEDEAWQLHWKGMPEYDNKNLKANQTLLIKYKEDDAEQSVLINFLSPEDKSEFAKIFKHGVNQQTKAVLFDGTREALIKIAGQNITLNTQSIWFPKAEFDIVKNSRWTGEWDHPKYPIYIVSKGRWETPITARHLEAMGIDYHIIVEPQEFDKYNSVGLKGKILKLDMTFKDRFETCDNKGDSIAKGSGAARNFGWWHSSEFYKSERHWIMDDNIFGFYRFTNNRQIKVTNRGAIRCMEDFVDRYSNIAMAGPNYFLMQPRKIKTPAFVLNTKLYSCNLIKNDLPIRWRGRFNEDVILSLDMLKAGWCTVQFNAILQHKAPTQTVKGGNTSVYQGQYEYEAIDDKGNFIFDKDGKHVMITGTGTAVKSQLLKRVHPDVTTLVFKFSRDHHEVDYGKWKQRQLIFKPGIIIPQGINNYNMELKENI